MTFIKTRSGRYINNLHIIALSVEEAKIEIDGKKRLVYKVVAYVSQPLLPAVLGIYSTEDKAREVLDQIIEKIAKEERIVYLESEY